MSKKYAPTNKQPDGKPAGLDFRGGPVTPWQAFRTQAIAFLNNHGVRELVESVVIAFVLAFLFKTFEAEAFVIPTGSMAPTLMGRHKDVECPQCGYAYQASASDEIDRESGARIGSVFAATCPMCRFTAVVDSTVARSVVGDRNHQLFNAGQLQGPGGNINEIHEPSYSGDRILVSKFAYEIDEPQRWDVIVFRFPEKATNNYIKRLVGLPGETLHIARGDLYTSPYAEDPYSAAAQREPAAIARKPPHKIRAMAQIVYDNNYARPPVLVAKGWPARWQVTGEGAADEAAAVPDWTTAEDGRSFASRGEAADESWLRYRHFVPSFADWERMLRPEGSIDYEVLPQLITDAYAYNSNEWAVREGVHQYGYRASDTTWAGNHWVGDLLLEFDVAVKESQGALLLDLVEGGVHFVCRIDLTDGRATLTINDGEYSFSDGTRQVIETPQADTPIRGPGNHRVALANVDNQIVLWVDGKVIPFEGFSDGIATYLNLPTHIPASTPDDPGDLAPAGIGSERAAVEISNMRLSRDVYYIAAVPIPRERHSRDYLRGPLSQSFSNESRATYDQRRRAFFSTPEAWPEVFENLRETIYPLAKFPAAPGRDQFFAAGDNSPQSSDSRAWHHNYFERQLLIGKAVFVYWPHPLNEPIPYFPNFEKMRFVR